MVDGTETQVDARWETTSAVVPFGDGCGHPVGWLDSESDCCVMDEIVLDPDMSPIISVRSVAVPTFLSTKSEVFSLAVLAGGGGRCCGSPPGCPHPILPEYCFRPCLLGYFSQLALLARVGRCPRLTPSQQYW